MGIRLTILGSGSSGNAGLLEVDGFGLLIDTGLGPQQIASLKHTRPGRVRDLVMLHLSRECNRPKLATTAAERIMDEQQVRTRLHVAAQDRPVRIAGGD